MSARLAVLALALGLAGCGGSAADDDGDALGPTSARELTVQEAVETGHEGTAAVRGTLFDDAEGLRLCGAIAESFPPQCGGEAIPVEGEPAGVEWQEAQGVRWTEREVVLEGELEGGVLRLGSS